MDIIAIIPARGGSKSIPRKNVRLFAGHPLIAHTIMAAREALGPDAAFVSTDDEEIAEVSKRYGAQVVWRPAELASDTASSESAVLHALEVLQREHRLTPTGVVFLQCTSPFTTARHVADLAKALDRPEVDSAFTARRSHGFLWRTDPANGATGVNHDKRVRLRRQDMEPEYLETGAGYAFRREGFLASKHRFFGRTEIVETAGVPPIEIDEVEDFDVAEAFLRSRRSEDA